ncbi:hypothetical protein Cantr_00557 [Candida viswanathii]|uniref:N-acetyltransferase domain-containing protein n=1 Tax=Candida viswanathii TaxID=5486 RepID=A0A367YGU6_9ASCO|nr:hypothetical protein Cantr_00557 [Candida viswanathii]
MASNIEFKSTTDPEIIQKLYRLCSTEWSGKLAPEKFVEGLTKTHVEYLKKGGKLSAYYLEDTTTGEIVASTCVKHIKAFYKPADKSSSISSIPDPSLFGVNNATGLLISFVFVHPDYRKKGLANLCVSKAIEATEDDIIKEKLDSSDEAVLDNFKKMSIYDGSDEVDRQLANYYLSKEYVWLLYSGVSTYYERFGFKAYPLDFYEIPETLLTEEIETVIEKLIQSLNEGKTGEHPKHIGKKLRFLRGDNGADQEIIQFILQNKELSILTEINKLVFHLELQSDRKSSTSLTNMSSILAMSKLGSNTALSSITESSNNESPLSPASPGSGAGAGTGLGRRQSGVHNQTTPKFAIKPTYLDYQWNASMEKEFFGSSDNEKANEFANIQGAIVTNELQQRSYYVLWSSLKGQFYITGMGEIQFQGIPTIPNGRRRRASSLSSLNELGGFNFQDIEILIYAAIHVAKNRLHPTEKVYVSVNDLPDEFPDTILFDFFTNYLPASSQSLEEKPGEGVTKIDPLQVKVLLNTDAAKSEIKVLPMLKKFGSKKCEFDLDWESNGMWCWG